VDILLSTKLRIPDIRPAQVARPRLISRLTEGLRLGRRLTLVSAPPGFGKTTMIREWLAATQRRPAWLTIDEGDNDPDRFLRYITAALGQENAAFPAAAVTPQERLVALINVLAAAGGDQLLVLDDYQEIRSFAVHDLVALLLAHQPSCLHLAIGTREDPPLPLSRLRARDQVTEIRARALRFTPEEATIFLNQTLRLNLSVAAVTALIARTEGWITALQLAGLALVSSAEGDQPAGAADEFVAAFAGDDCYIADYLMAEVLERQPEPLRQFLRQTAILDRLCAPLCEAISGREDSQALLERLEATNLFLTPLDHRREWYRYHGLFAEMLRLTLNAQQQAELHRRAAGWCDAAGHPDLAVRHARRAAELASISRPSRSMAPAHQPLIEPLSERELEVLQLIAAGLSNQEIADRLIIAPGTVKRHINNIYGKLQVGSRTQALAVARDLQIL
jgi:LuxR family transcriptional regulator, maltose regulon positive regulatory protein